jgi:thioredoxin 1
MDILNLTDENFGENIKTNKIVLVDFWAPWCEACRIIGPALEDAVKDFSEINIAKVNIDEAPLISEEYKVNQIPAVFLFKDGKVVSMFIGAYPKETIKEWLRENLKKDHE